MKNKKIISLILLSVLVIGCLAGCGSSSDSMMNSIEPMWNGAVEEGISYDSVSSGLGDYKGYSNNSSVEESYDYEVSTTTETENTTELGVETNIKDESIIQQEKLVYTARVTMETKEYVDSMNYLHTKITENDGVIENEDQKNLSYDDAYGFSSSYILVRIPQNNYEKFLSEISSNASLISIVNISRTVDNFTTIYSDLEVEIQSLEVMRDRLFAYLEKASSVEEMLEIESRIANNQMQLNKLINSRNKIDRDVAYSTVHINLKEVREYTETPKPKDTFLTRLKGYLERSGRNFLNSAEDLLEFIIMAFPSLVIWGIIIFFVVKFIKKNKAKKGLKPKKLKPEKIKDIESVKEKTEELDDNKEE